MTLYFLFFLFAFLYSMVGLGGGSAYVALLGLGGIEHKFIPSTSLFLNIIVSVLSFINYRIHLNFKSRRNFLFFLYSLSILGVYLGTRIYLKKEEFMIVLGGMLIFTSILSILNEYVKKLNFKINLPIIPAAGFFAGIIAGLIGIGGGILISSLLLLTEVSEKEIPTILSIFVFINSSGGFLSHFINGNVNFSIIFPFTFFVLCGALAGSFLGSFKLKPVYIKRILSLVIMFFGVKILWTGIF